MWIDKLDDILNKCNNTNHSIIKIKPTNIKDDAYVDSGKKK